MKPLKRCANGCDAPVCPPSRVICRSCMDRITANLEEIGKRMEAAATPNVAAATKGVAHEQKQEVAP